MARFVAPALLAVLLGAGATHGVHASPDRVPVLAHWYQSVGQPLAGESFGQFLTRVAQTRIGTPYWSSPETGTGEEALAVDLEHFECVSFIESSLAVARCAWRADPTEACFVWEVVGLRYRGGLMADYASRLHYFVDWLADNEGRWRLKDLTAELGGRPVRRDFFYLSGHAAMVPALARPGMRRSVAATEGGLSSRQYFVLGRNDISSSLDALQDGDLIAVVGNKPGRLVTHTGVIVKGERGGPRLLHASSYRHRVVLTREDVADYVTRRPERSGIIVARPLPPK